MLACANWAFSWPKPNLGGRKLAGETSQFGINYRLMRIVVDAMGGDNAPDEIVLGAANAARATKDVQICLVGDQRRIKALLPAKSTVEVRHCEDYFRMDEHAGPGLRGRKQASMMVAARMIKEGEAQAFVCAGNTGALHQVAALEIGRIKGIRRSALAAVFPTRPAESLALDVGANADLSARITFG